VERELWPILYHALRAASAAEHRKKVRYQPWVIAAVLLWAAIHDRPRSWACVEGHWDTTDLRPDEVPSPSTVSRRARRAEVADLLDRLAERLRGDGPPAWELVVDGKPLPVGRCSKDPDARGTPMGRGYKLHAVWGDRCLPEAWAVTAACEYEGAAAERLLAGVSGRGVLLADGNYEASRLYDAAADSGYQLLARPDGRDTGRGHRYQSEHRLLALRWFADGLGWALLRGRGAIERAFGNAGSFGGGLGPLPNWVRRLGRVTCWVHCKLLINAARIIRRRQRIAQMQ
jgi:Transposase DDE domain